MLGHQFAYSAAPIRKVKGVKLYSFSKRDSCVSPFHVLCSPLIFIFMSQKAMDEATHKPKMGGLMDPRMGTIDPNFKCQTCSEEGIPSITVFQLLFSVSFAWLSYWRWAISLLFVSCVWRSVSSLSSKPNQCHFTASRGPKIITTPLIPPMQT